MGMQAVAVTPSNSVRYGLLIAALLVGVLVVLFLAIQSPPDLYVPRSWLVNFDNVSLGRAIENLEHRGVLPYGVTWQDSATKNRSVTARWFTATDEQGLALLAERAGVQITCPVGYHGNIEGAINIAPPRGTKGGLVFQMQRHATN